ncbi:MAG TPA: hypothetical protein VFM18_20795 [Methanosarcina sp.]|nr:hypothetical protein [Methanosarcina sp.]
MYKFIFLMLLSFPAMADEWTQADATREAVYLAVDIIDWAQTRNIARNPNKWYEQNNILGNHPSVEKVDAYFATMALAHIAISYALPSEYRRTFQYITIGIEIGYIHHNYSMGINAKF